MKRLLIIGLLLSQLYSYSQYCVVPSILPQKDTIVQASGYYVLNSGTITLPSADTFFAVSLSNRTKIRQAGKIEYIKFYLPSKPASITSFWFQVWRKDATKYDLVAEEEIWSSMVTGENTITLSNTFNVIEGDLVGYGYTSTGNPGNFLNAISLGNSGRYVTTIPTGIDFNWTGGTALTRYWPINIYMKAPVIVAIGHSMVAGHPQHDSYIEPTITPDNPYSTYISKIGQILNVPVQNMGYGGQGSSTIKNRFAADVVALKPRYVIIDAATNDIPNNLANIYIVANYVNMIEQSINAGIVPIVLAMLPWTDGTPTQHQQVDSLNVSLAALKQTYPSMIWVDATNEIGNPDNKHEIFAPYNADRTHLKENGNTVLANKIVQAIIHN